MQGEALASASAAQFVKMAQFLAESESFDLEHFDLECYVTTEGREMLRLMLQEHFELGALRERRLEEVRDADDVAYRSVERDHGRPLASVVGALSIGRLAYRHRGQESLYLADAAANLPVEVHSHGMRELAAIESSRGSFAEAKEAIWRASGQVVGQRQVEQLARAAAVDFEAFYGSDARPEASGEDVVVITADGKGVVMREAALRPGTAKAAAKAQNKLKTRLSPGEKANRKRMAEVVGVYTVEPVPRSPEEVLASHDEGPKAAPEAKDKWLAASVEQDAADVIARAFTEADSRDPEHSHDWVALVDGANHQIDRIKAEAKSRGAEVTIVVDCVHVLGYIWDAAWSFFDKGDPAAEKWVREKMLEVLRGKASLVAASIRRKATYLALEQTKRKNADVCAEYLLAKAPYLNYPKALSQGWPVGTGIIEAACRYLVQDRLEVTGARWGLNGAEAVLKLRALRKNGDWERYWRFHLAQERRRVHESRYLNKVIPAVA